MTTLGGHCAPLDDEVGMTEKQLLPLPLRERVGVRGLSGSSLWMSGLALCAIAFLAIFETQLAEATVLGTFRQESAKRFVPSLPSEPVKAIDFSINHGNLPIRQGDITFSGTVAYDATNGYYEAAGSATGRLTFPTKLRTKITVEPIALTWSDPAISVAGLTNIISSGNFPWLNMGRLGFDGSKLLAVSINGHVATSIDGISWRQQGTRPLYEVTEQVNWYMGAAYGNGTWVAVSVEGYVATSADGTDWTSRGSLPVGNFQTSLFFANGIFMTQGYSTCNIYTSPDGITWTPRGNCPAVARVMGYSHGRWIAGQGNMYSSTDNGAHWTLIDDSLGKIHHITSDFNYNNEWYGTCLVGGKHYAINYTNGNLAVSLDGSNWKNLGKNPSFTKYRNITYLNGAFISLYQNGASLFVTNAGTRSVKFSGLSLLNGGTTNDPQEIAASREFVIEASQIPGSDGAAEYHIDFDMQQVRLISVEQESTQTVAIPADIIFYPATQVNQTENEVVAAIAPDSRFSLAETKIHLTEGSTVLANFVCDSASLVGGKTPLAVQADLGTRTVELKGDWRKFQAAPFTTTGAGTLKIATAASLPQSDITIGTGGALEFGDSTADYTTGAGTILDLRGCSSVSGGKSLTLGAGARLIF